MNRGGSPLKTCPILSGEPRPPHNSSSSIAPPSLSVTMLYHLRARPQRSLAMRQARDCTPVKVLDCIMVAFFSLDVRVLSRSPALNAAPAPYSFVACLSHAGQLDQSKRRVRWSQSANNSSAATSTASGVVWNAFFQRCTRTSSSVCIARCTAREGAVAPKVSELQVEEIGRLP